MVTLHWAEFAGPGEVSYSLHLAPVDDFFTPILVKDELSEPEYNLSGDDIPAPGTYGWRVKAIDAAGNETPWSVVWQMEIVSASNQTIIWFIASLVLFVVLVVLGILTWRANKPS